MKRHFNSFLPHLMYIILLQFYFSNECYYYFITYRLFHEGDKSISFGFQSLGISDNSTVPEIRSSLIENILELNLEWKHSESLFRMRADLRLNFLSFEPSGNRFRIYSTLSFSNFSFGTSGLKLSTLLLKRFLYQNCSIILALRNDEFSIHHILRIEHIILFPYFQLKIWNIARKRHDSSRNNFSPFFICWTTFYCTELNLISSKML